MVNGTHNHTEHRHHHHHHHHHHHIATPITLRAVDYRGKHTVQDHSTIAEHTTATVLGTVLPVIALVFFAFFVWERCISRKKKQEGQTNEGTFVV
jgi:heme/copper-type cytochrome/quinol oxidase subunit 2